MVRDLRVYHDVEPHSAALNMAIDEALFESAALPSLRFYRWRAPAVSFGYFGRCADAEREFPECELVRRWTGGGTVPHGSDLTYSVILPPAAAWEFGSSRAVYATIHAAICRALAAQLDVALATVAAPKISDACFANPVQHDVIAAGRKIAGAAQRRTRAGLLHQGSIQCEPLPQRFAEDFATELCLAWKPESLTPQLLVRADELAVAKYASVEWLRRR